jgi:putative ABC transport system ATP-binding protein
MLQLLDVRKSYQSGRVTVPVLRGISLCVNDAEVCAITGTSGSGKSTLLNLIGLLDQPDSGSLMIDGQVMRGASPDALARLRNSRIGFVFQAFHLLPRLTAIENVALPLLYRGVPRRARYAMAVAMLDRVGLADRGSHRPDALSGGQRQRVAIARALVGEPSLILADEPTGSLDSSAAGEIMALLLDLNREARITLIIVTHDSATAARCARQIVLRDGLLCDER